LIKKGPLPVIGLLYFSLLAAAVSCESQGRKEREESMRTDTLPDSIAGWPRGVVEVRIRSSFDSTDQPALFWAPPDLEGPRPLLVALHTWSGNYLQESSVPYQRWCAEHGWVFIHPNFRGPNNTPQAAGSLAAYADILDAVTYARQKAHVDSGRIYLAGVSGGGHMSLLTAGREPGIWAAVSSWVPISDLAAWYAQCAGRGPDRAKYAGDMIAACGGPPGTGAEVDSQYSIRSPLTILGRAVGVPIEICAGIDDGYTGSVPISHTLRAFNILAKANGMPGKKLTERQIEYFVERRGVPPELKGEVEEDPAYGENKVLFRRSAGPVRVTIFAGGHEIVYEAALSWLDGHRKSCF